MENKAKLKERKLIHKGSILDYYCDEMQFTNGSTEKWDYIDHKPVVAIVPYDEDGNIICVKQYRHAVQELSIEIPAGGINDNESPMEGALRELREETGYICDLDTVVPLIEMYTSIGYTNEKIYIFTGQVIEKTKRELDLNENIDVLKISLKEIKQMIFDMKIRDGKTIGAIMSFINFAKSIDWYML